MSTSWRRVGLSLGVRHFISIGRSLSAVLVRRLNDFNGEARWASRASPSTVGELIRSVRVATGQVNVLPMESVEFALAAPEISHTHVMLMTKSLQLLLEGLDVNLELRRESTFLPILALQVVNPSGQRAPTLGHSLFLCPQLLRLRLGGLRTRRTILLCM